MCEQQPFQLRTNENGNNFSFPRPRAPRARPETLSEWQKRGVRLVVVGREGSEGPNGPLIIRNFHKVEEKPSSLPLPPFSLSLLPPSNSPFPTFLPQCPTTTTAKEERRPWEEKKEEMAAERESCIGKALPKKEDRKV